MGDIDIEHYDSIGKFTYTVDEAGKYHSYNDKPAINYHNGSYVWMKHGVLHRENYFAFKLINDKYRWKKHYIDGKLHNPNGPALVCKSINNGYKYISDYYLNGIRYDSFECCNGKIHGVQTSYLNDNIPCKEFWIMGEKQDYDTLPHIVTKDNVVYVLGYGYEIIDDNKFNLSPSQYNKEYMVSLHLSDNMMINQIGQGIKCIPFKYNEKEFLENDIIIGEHYKEPEKEPEPSKTNKKTRTGWIRF